MTEFMYFEWLLRFIKGVIKGYEQGREEARIEAAKNMLALDMPLDQISYATKLSIADLKTLGKL